MPGRSIAGRGWSKDNPVSNIGTKKYECTASRGIFMGPGLKVFGKMEEICGVNGINVPAAKKNRCGSVMGM